MPVITSERTIQHPVETLYQAFAQAELLAQWWGPNGFTNRFEVFDLQPGGYWIFDMVDENGKAYPNHAAFQEVKANESVSWTRLSAPAFDMRVSFEKISDTTSRIGFHMLVADERLYQTLMGFVPAKNEENFDRLEALLAKMK